MGARVGDCSTSSCWLQSFFIRTHAVDLSRDRERPIQPALRSICLPTSQIGDWAAKLPASALRFAGVACTFGAEGHANQRVPHPPSAGSSHVDLHPALLIQTLHARFRPSFRRSFALLKHRRALSVFGCPSIEHQLHPTRHSSAPPPFTVHGPPTQPLARKEIATVYWHCRRFGYRYVYSQPRGRVEKCRLMAPPLCTGCQASRWSLRHWMWRP